ncbi:MAG TPA: hypothetical protein VLN25_03785 [Burkholderiaceae bacterium]|nr:hypothetical protein [Burkholderiaceae bacterium]
MTDLHWALLTIAGVLLLAIWIYSKWQERRALARLDAAMRQGVGDPLLGTRPLPSPAASSRRIEPRLDGAGGVGNDAATASQETAPEAERTAVEVADQSADEGAEVADERSEPSAYALPDGWSEDPLLDFVIELRCAHAIDGVAALEAKGQLERLQLPLPTHLAVWDAKTQQWTGPDRFGFYSELLIAVQMAHRNGVLGEIDAARFVAATQQIALGIDADFDAPDVPRLVAQAAELDRVCARFDVQVTLTLESGETPWTADVIQAAAIPVGFTAVGSGRWEMREASGELALSMTAGALPANRLAIFIDVPLVRPEGSPLARQFAVADQLATRLNARVVDDNGKPVQREAHFAIAAQLAGMYEQMQAAGIAAGSERARRLYAV